MNLVFIGTPLFARNILEGLHIKHNILGVITQTDKPFGRKKILKAPEVKQYALSSNIPYFQPQRSIDIKETLNNIESNGTAIDAIVVVAYGKILPSSIVDRYLCLNLHGSILPYFRGASPVQHSIMNNYAHFGLTVISMDSSLDTGDILATKNLSRQDVESLEITDVFKALAPHGIELLDSVIKASEKGELIREAQAHHKATYCAKISKQDCILNLDDSKESYLRYLALCDRGVSIICKYGKLKLNTIISYEETGYEKTMNEKEHYAKTPQTQKGTILEIDFNKESFSLACEQGKLWIKEVTPENKPKMKALSFLQSKGLKAGDTLLAPKQS
ncbi:methionyl-tRNA formyltransferase [Helicobacter muridarum]|uniref:methionyl-tRNA formyltransferase n=1 Tax=Helicobacter muridarum TaxID=216 RepID=A0A099TY79_9HELI|nr:methionyl-tRNA formyltransferase [Helicobacter muridarum]TLD98893.1 methionyl-tRNA formyltransferase [Helicobacter muridarum]STQ87142.1 methionyl-tRNA formyltransferase [Helicobacter muridarum]